MDASCSTLCATASIKDKLCYLLGAATQSPWDRACTQGLTQANGALHGVWSTRDMTSASSTNTKSLAGLQLWWPLLVVFETKRELHCQSSTLVGGNLVESRSCPIMKPLLVVQNKNSERRVLSSATCITIRQLLPCRKFSKICSIMTHCPSSKTLLWACCQQEQCCPEASVLT